MAVTAPKMPAVALVFAIAALGLVSCSLEPRPHIVVEPEKIELGEVEPDDLVDASFVVKNTGNAPLKITEAKSECGCTANNFKPTSLAPGKSLAVNVKVDTSMKQGPILKDIAVYSDDMENIVVRVFLSMNVKDVHADKMKLATIPEGRLKMFREESCRRCHVDEGVGQVGKELFEADCALCHRTQPSGITSAPLIEEGDYSTPEKVARMRKIIIEGSPHSVSMPGFAAAHGGPLAPEQVDSLVNYLKNLKK